MWTDWPADGRPPRLGAGRAARFAAGLVLIGAALVSGCAPVVVGGTAVGASVIHDRRPTAVLLDDQRIEMIARSRYDDTPEIAARSRISVTSYNRVALLTGQAENPVVRRRYAELVSRIPHVKRVVDQVTIGSPASLQRESQDAYLTSRVKVALASVKLDGFDPTRVKVVTEGGVVHLLGLLTPREAEAVVATVRHVPGVVQVVKLFERYDHGETDLGAAAQIESQANPTSVSPFVGSASRPRALPPPGSGSRLAAQGAQAERRWPPARGMAG